MFVPYYLVLYVRSKRVSNNCVDVARGHLAPTEDRGYGGLGGVVARFSRGSRTPLSRPFASVYGRNSAGTIYLYKCIAASKPQVVVSRYEVLQLVVPSLT